MRRSWTYSPLRRKSSGFAEVGELDVEHFLGELQRLDGHLCPALSSVFIASYLLNDTQRVSAADLVRLEAFLRHERPYAEAPHSTLDLVLVRYVEVRQLLNGGRGQEASEILDGALGNLLEYRNTPQGTSSGT